MAIVELRDKEKIATFCRRRAGAHAYSLGDLDDFFWPHTRWWGWEEHGELEQLVLLYDEPSTPVLLAIAEQPETSMQDLLAELVGELPDAIYTHVTPSCLTSLTTRWSVAGEAELHYKLSIDPMVLPPRDEREREAAFRLLSPIDIGEVEEFYGVAYAGTWFHARMLETQRYVGLDVGGVLAAVAGVHVYSPTWGAAALGNVATRPELRGHGYGRLVCLALCRLLAGDGITTISLNVRADNPAALAVYDWLGFVRVADYLEATLR